MTQVSSDFNAKDIGDDYGSSAFVDEAAVISLCKELC